MRSDEQLIKDEVESTTAELSETALRIYEATGASAVLEWGYKVRLAFSPCEPCELDTPDIGDEGGTCCAVCGSVK